MGNLYISAIKGVLSSVPMALAKEAARESSGGHVAEAASIITNVAISSVRGNAILAMASGQADSITGLSAVSEAARAMSYVSKQLSRALLAEGAGMAAQLATGRGALAAAMVMQPLAAGAVGEKINDRPLAYAPTPEAIASDLRLSGLAARHPELNRVAEARRALNNAQTDESRVDPKLSDRCLTAVRKAAALRELNEQLRSLPTEAKSGLVNTFDAIQENRTDEMARCATQPKPYPDARSPREMTRNAEAADQCRLDVKAHELGAKDLSGPDNILQRMGPINATCHQASDKKAAVVLSPNLKVTTSSCFRNAMQKSDIKDATTAIRACQHAELRSARAAP